MAYVPCEFASGTFPVSKTYHLRQMLYNYSCGRVAISDQVIPSFPFSDVPVYADTVDLETLAFHDVWGGLLTPDNLAAKVTTDDVRYHVWVAAKRVIESGLIDPGDKTALIRAVTHQFMVELGLVLLDLFPGPLVLFVDPRLHDDAERMVSSARAMVAQFDAANVRRWRLFFTVPATDQGIRAARELTQRGIHAHLALVSCLPHAMACIDSGARMVSMGVAPMRTWFEQRQATGNAIDAVQSCATYITQRRLNTTLLVTDADWTVLKGLSGIGAAALTQTQLDQIPKQRLVTWHSPDDPMVCDEGPPQVERMGVLASLPAECSSLVSAVLYGRLRQMARCMDAIDSVIWTELGTRLRLNLSFDQFYRDEEARRGRTRTRRRATDMVDGIDYF